MGEVGRWKAEDNGMVMLMVVEKWDAVMGADYDKKIMMMLIMKSVMMTMSL